MAYQYVVSLPTRPTKPQLYWAWWFTVMSRVGYKCEADGCGKDAEQASHKMSVRHHPERRYDPDNGQAMCQSCHHKYDHANGHVPNGRPVGYKMTAEWKAEHSARMGRIYANPTLRAAQGRRAKEWWRTVGIQHPPKPCEQCGHEFKPRMYNHRFCSRRCAYAWRTGRQHGNRRRVPHPCVTCGIEIDKPGPVTKYCSRLCFWKARFPHKYR